MSFPQPARAAVVGPNAVLQTLAVLRARIGGARTRVLLDRAGCADWIGAPPEAMVDEAEVARLHQAIRRFMPREAPWIAEEAGRRTADYILAHRIPRMAQAVLRIAPPPLAHRMLSKAIAENAWTFAGSGRFTVDGSMLEIVANPFVAGETARAPVCDWHVAVFRQLYRTLVAPGAEVREVTCCAMGAPACRFEVVRGAGVLRAAS